MPDYATDRTWSDQYLSAITRIVGPHLLMPAPFEVDAHEATDLMVLRARDMMIAARVRRPGYADRYPWEFTVRAARDTGAKTELAKIVEGFGDWMFYGHADPETIGVISRWLLVDLHALRAHLIRHQTLLRSRGATGNKANGDGTFFKWFDVRFFPAEPSILVASSDPLLLSSPNIKGAA